MFSVDEFPALAISNFEWLTIKFPFVVSDRKVVKKDGQPIYASVTWHSSDLFVEVVLECPRPALDVQFGPILRGQVPDMDDLDNRFHLDLLRHTLSRSSEAGLPPHIDLDSLRRRDILRSLESASKEFEYLGWPILNGDLHAFDQLRESSRRLRDALWKKYGN